MPKPESIETQEGEVTAKTPEPPSANVVGDVAYGNPLDAQAARERIAQLENPVFRGEDWSDLPNFYCPLCSYATLDGDDAVFAHGRFMHPGVNLKEHIGG